MEGTKPRISDNSRVRLRGLVDPTFYEGMAKTGNEGWVRKHRIDRNGLPEVWVEWDREHWADNMQPNRWTFEEHFDVVEEGSAMAEDNDITPEDMKLFLQFRQMMQGQEKSVAPDPEVIDLEANHQAHFVAQKERATELMNEAEAFFYIGVSRQVDGESSPRGALVVGTAGDSLSPETDLVLGMQLSAFAARFHDEAALMLIQHLTTDDDDGDY
jgi:hypothetical protein